MEEARLVEYEKPVEEAKLVKARVIASIFNEALSSVYRAAKTGEIPSYNVGPKRGGVRFNIEEVREALRRPVMVRKPR